MTEDINNKNRSDARMDKRAAALRENLKKRKALKKQTAKQAKPAEKDQKDANSEG